MIELKECPFCGGKAIFRSKSTIIDSVGAGFHYSIKCQKCGLEYPEFGTVQMRLNEDGTVSFIQDDRYELAVMWNFRIEKNAELPTLEEAERNQIKKYFKGKCPYTDKKCEDWRCQNCKVEAAERKYMENDSEE